jgi:hypothetical protein
MIGFPSIAAVSSAGGGSPVALGLDQVWVLSWTRTSIDPAAVPNHCRGGRGFEPLVCSEGFNRVNAGRSLPALPLAAGAADAASSAAAARARSVLVGGATINEERLDHG